MLRAFYDWWIAELAGLFMPASKGPKNWQTLLLDSDDTTTFYVKNRGKPSLVAEVRSAEIMARTKEAMNAAKALSQSGKKTLVRLAPSDVLERQLEIPAGASDVIEPVLKNQMDRMVPWPPEETSFGYKIDETESNIESNQLKVRVIATTKSVLSRAKERAQLLGLSTSAIDYADADYENVGIELLALEADPKERIQKSVHRLTTLCLLAALTIGGFGFYQLWHGYQAMSEADSQVAEIRSRLAKINAAQELDAQRQIERQFVLRRRASEPAAMILLEAMTQALPDGTYLTDFQIDGREITVTGRSDNPTALVQAVEQRPQFEKAKFVAATTVDENDSGDSFALQAMTLPAPLVESGKPSEQEPKGRN